MGKNYRVKEGEYQPLSDIMGADYETTDKYGIHVDEMPIGNLLSFTYRTGEPPLRTDRGREFPSFSVIEVAADTGDDCYLRGTNGPVDIEIFVIPEA